MTTLEQEIEELKKKHANLEQEAYNLKLKQKYEQLKALEGTVEVRIVKSSKTTRHIYIVHHISYEMAKDSWKRENELQHNYIAAHVKNIIIMEAPRTPYRQYEIQCTETMPTGHDGKIHVSNEGYSYDYSTHKSISVAEFDNIWHLAKVTTANVIDGMIGVKDIPWLMNGTDHDFEFSTTKEHDYQKFALDIPHVLLTQEESWKLNNKFTRIFLNQNIYMISPNSLKALDEWLKDERRSDRLAAEGCASVGERWRGSRIDEYEAIVAKIKSHK